MPNDIEQIKNTIGSLSKALNEGQQYARMEDIMDILASIKSALNFLKTKDEDLEETVDRHSQQLEVISNLLEDKSNFRDEVKNGMSTANAKHETFVRDITTRLGALESDINNSLKSKTSDFEKLKSRADGFEFSMSNIGTKSVETETNLNMLKKEFGDILTEMRKELNTLKETVITTRTNGGVRRVFQPYVERFTHLTNGSRKVFYLSRAPLKTDTIKVWGTDFPIILDPAVDFTVEDKTLTLSDQIQAPSSGATLIIEYFA